VSASLVSQIETGKSQPSVSTLYAITKALGISVEDVFDTEAGESGGGDNGIDVTHPEGVPAPRRPAQRPAATSVPNAAGTVADVVASMSTGVVPDALERRVGPIVRAGDREVLELDSGVTWERLGRVPGTPVDFLLVTYAPGGSSSGTGLLMRHSGVEYGYLLSGELALTLGFDEYRLLPGDAVSFPSTTPHRYGNDGGVPAVGVWFVDDSGSGVH
jgi:quercetin dioxygenase-like cupin family protein/DNA-binding XRE family transcriptional regulator